eukprot:CAMPEP_0119403890 /NCGR_PEP_ID=MMETSP1334-20130426/143615_1 /TAXON_ID=127549 /ORGANISM="Calcidiscus leptoporus, Strain RCC1130" /LENGTH=394 /DNA_ID=CAMNT_0007427841 /DNA_START=178 /DNA_END=1363 /DNA_ORIENTATION=-
MSRRSSRRFYTVSFTCAPSLLSLTPAAAAAPAAGARGAAKARLAGRGARAPQSPPAANRPGQVPVRSRSRPGHVPVTSWSRPGHVPVTSRSRPGHVRPRLAEGDGIQLESGAELDHLLDEGQADIARAEGGHRLALVEGDDAVEERHVEALGSAEEAKDSNHREAAVVDLHQQPALLGRLVHLAEELERIVQVEGHRVRDELALLERRVVARLAALGVVRDLHLADPLKQEDGAEDLQLARGGDGIPLLIGEASGCDVGEHRRRLHLLPREARRELSKRASGDRPREDNPVGLEAVAHERRHCHAAVLDLGVAQPADGRLLPLVVQVDVHHAKRVPEPNVWVEAVGERGEVFAVSPFAAAFISVGGTRAVVDGSTRIAGAEYARAPAETTIIIL